MQIFRSKTSQRLHWKEGFPFPHISDGTNQNPQIFIYNVEYFIVIYDLENTQHDGFRSGAGCQRVSWAGAARLIFSW